MDYGKLNVENLLYLLHYSIDNKNYFPTSLGGENGPIFIE